MFHRQKSSFFPDRDAVEARAHLTQFYLTCWFVYDKLSFSFSSSWSRVLGLKSCAKCMRIYTAINTPSIFAPLRIRWMTNHSGLTGWCLVIYVGKRVKTDKGRLIFFRVFIISPRSSLILSKFNFKEFRNLDFIEIL